VDVLNMPDVQAKLRNLSVEPLPMTPAQLDAYIKDESRRWGAVVKQIGVVVD